MATRLSLRVLAALVPTGAVRSGRGAGAPSPTASRAAAPVWSLVGASIGTTGVCRSLFRALRLLGPRPPPLRCDRMSPRHAWLSPLCQLAAIRRWRYLHITAAPALSPEQVPARALRRGGVRAAYGRASRPPSRGDDLRPRTRCPLIRAPPGAGAASAPGGSVERACHRPHGSTRPAAPMCRDARGSRWAVRAGLAHAFQPLLATLAAHRRPVSGASTGRRSGLAPPGRAAGAPDRARPLSAATGPGAVPYVGWERRRGGGRVPRRLPASHQPTCPPSCSRRAPVPSGRSAAGFCPFPDRIAAPFTDAHCRLPGFRWSKDARALVAGCPHCFLCGGPDATVIRTPPPLRAYGSRSAARRSPARGRASRPRR
jgi:hypothetical protein